nr:PHD finger protein MALE MEIOCYTE DEATH 1 [Ipomoea batatas]
MSIAITLSSIAITLSSSQHYDDEEEAAGEREGGSRLTNTRTKEKLPASGKGFMLSLKSKGPALPTVRPCSSKRLIRTTIPSKPLGKDRIGSYVVHRAVNRATRVLEYTLQE